VVELLIVQPAANDNEPEASTSDDSGLVDWSAVPAKSGNAKGKKK
jgi:hypothetical protein